MDNDPGFHAYILLGNVLSHLLRGRGQEAARAVGAEPGAIAALYAKLEPRSPREIVPGVEALAPEEKTLLGRCAQACLDAMNDDQVAGLLGLSRAEAIQVLRELALEPVSRA